MSTGVSFTLEGEIKKVEGPLAPAPRHLCMDGYWLTAQNNFYLSKLRLMGLGYFFQQRIVPSRKRTHNDIWLTTQGRATRYVIITSCSFQSGKNLVTSFPTLIFWMIAKPKTAFTALGNKLNRRAWSIKCDLTFNFYGCLNNVYHTIHHPRYMICSNLS